MSLNAPVPTNIVLHKQSRLLELAFEDGTQARLSHEFLRVCSPSAEVKGHGEGQEVLQTGKREVTVLGIEPVGNYAVKLVFSDGHDSGIFSWDYLYRLCREHDALWADYLRRIEEAGASREPGALSLAPRAAPHCGKH